MNQNPYAPPSANVADISPAQATAPPFFAVSALKLVVLSLCTLGLYELYWFYRNWKLIKVRQEPGILPFWRAFFGVLFCYSCFVRIRDAGADRGITPALPAGPLAAGWIITTLVWKLPDPYSLFTFLSVAFLLPVQAHASRVNDAAAPVHDSNSRFSGWNWATVAVGGMLLALVVIGEFLPAP
jgi:hypothetical protein